MSREVDTSNGYDNLSVDDLRYLRSRELLPVEYHDLLDGGPEAGVENYEEEDVQLSEMSKGQLQKLLDDQNVEYNSSATKAELLELFED